MLCLLLGFSFHICCDAYKLHDGSIGATPTAALSQAANKLWNAAGLVMVQLALSKVRSDSGLKAFNSALQKASFDLTAWRKRAGLAAKETTVLDFDDGAGWELAEALLRPRQIDVDPETGTVKFVNTNREAVRLGVSLALTHKFLKQVRHRAPA